MRRPREELSALKLRTTLQQLKQFSSRHPPHQIRPPLESSPVGITLISLQPYRSKRIGEPRSNRQNIENQLKSQIFKKIRQTMQSRLNYNGLEIAKATMHCNYRSTQTSKLIDTQSRRKKMKQNEIKPNTHYQNRCLRVKTENSSTYRPYESTNHHFSNRKQRRSKVLTSERKFRTEFSEFQQSVNDLNGWNISNEQQDFCPRN